MGALLNLWNSERGLVAIAAVIAATVMVFTGHMTMDKWQEFTTWILTTYIAAKTATGIATAISPNAQKPPGAA